MNPISHLAQQHCLVGELCALCEVLIDSFLEVPRTGIKVGLIYSKVYKVRRCPCVSWRFTLFSSEAQLFLNVSLRLLLQTVALVGIANLTHTKHMTQLRCRIYQGNLPPLKGQLKNISHLIFWLKDSGHINVVKLSNIPHYFFLIHFLFWKHYKAWSSVFFLC